MSEQTNRNNVLFIGNGLDRLAGYNTDYPSFLKHYLNNYFLALMKMYEMEIQKMEYKVDSSKRGKRSRLKVSDNELKEILLHQFSLISKDDLPQSIKNSYYIDVLGKKKLLVEDLETRLSLERLGYVSLTNELYTECIQLDDITSAQTVNSWLFYFQYLWLKGEKKGENWSDLETIIFLNSKIGVLEASDAEIEDYEKVNRKFKTNQGVLPSERHFNEMKTLLIDYLNIEKGEILETKINQLDNQVKDYGTALNFNYSSTYCLPSEANIDVFYIHGTHSDGDNIVFGFDDGMLMEKTAELRHVNAKQNHYQYRKGPYKKFSKTTQLLNLSTIHQNDKIIKLPSQSLVEKIGILGHGIGEADYNYFQTLCDFEKVKIEVFWYSYMCKDISGENYEKNNKEELQEAIMNMLQEMEKRTETQIMHRMLIEQRIIFTKLEY